MVIFMTQDDKQTAAGNQGRKEIPPPEALAQLPPDGGDEYNRLVFEKSPYLLQHAANPVDWYPWGEEAFVRAAEEDRPIFLSIGYATCHWCHVMEHQSFEDTTVARLMNETFVCIKVDREERPDIDQLYMSVCQAMTGSGGWPLTIIMTAEKHPFFAGTYFPKESMPGRIGMLDLAKRIAGLWQNERQKLLDDAARIVDFMQKNAVPTSGDELSPQLPERAFAQLSSQFDEAYGGFGRSPKFPSPHNLSFLLRYWHRSGEKQALEMVEKTLQNMRLGGLFDQVGFGFHRYSTDRVWLLPHFEKMLYDQAMLALAYLEAYQATKNETYATTAREIFTYVLKDMTSPEGGFYSAEDADSEGEEGLFYLWTPEELKKVLGEEDGKWVAQVFNVVEGGNFHDQATGEKTGGSILHLTKPPAELAVQFNMTEAEFQTRWDTARRKLFQVREKRIHPLKDDKILTDWNGLMIAAFARGAAVLAEPAYEQAARKAMNFIWTKLRDQDGGLLKRYREGEAALPAHLDDYAFQVWGLLELYEATFEPGYLSKAVSLNSKMMRIFGDDKNGGFYFAADNLADHLIVRNKDIYDGAIPSGNSVAALNLVRLARLTGDETLADKARGVGRAFSQQVSQAPIGYTQLMSALDFWTGPSYEIVVAGKLENDDTQAMISALRQVYLPNKVLVFRPEENATEITKIAKYTEYQQMIDGKATAYVCQNFACNQPTADMKEMLRQLGVGETGE